MADERNKKDNNELNRKTMNTLCLLLIMCTNLESLATDVTIAKISKHKKTYFVIILFGILGVAQKFIIHAKSEH